MSGSGMLPGLGRIYEETKRISRILELIQIISARPDRCHRRDLAARFEISERMIQKDLDVIRNGLKLALGRSAGGYRFEEQWRKSQEVETLPDGSVRFRLRLPITPDFVNWILYCGWRVEVASPKELRDQVAEEHRRAAERYFVDEAGILKGGRIL